MSKHVLISVLCTAVIISVLFLTLFRPDPVLGPGGYTDTASASTLLHMLEERLDALEQRFDESLTDRTPIGDDPPPLTSIDADQTKGNETDGSSKTVSAEDISRLRSAINDLDYRIRALEEDPINRGYTFLNSENPELRRRGIQSLFRLARLDPAAREAIRGMLDDDDPRVREEAADAVGRLGDKEAVPMLVQLLNDPEAGVRKEAVQNLSRLGAKEAADAVAKLLSDPSDRVREEAADVLGRLRASQAAPLLLEALKDKNEKVRGEAIASLGEINAREALPLLRQIYDTDPGPHKYRLIRALQSLGDTGPLNQEVKRLSEVALNAENVRDRAKAIQMLSWLAPKEARPVFQKALEDSNGWVRKEAERALRRK